MTKGATAKQTFRRERFAWALIVIGIIMILVSLGFSIQSRNHPTPKAPPDSSQTAPSSVKPTPQTVASYHVAPTLPKYISIPASNVTKARVIQLGLLSNGQVATPDNVYDTGWYDGSAQPGQAGAMFIYGHVSNLTTNGVFYNLKKLKPGDSVMVTRGDNTTYTYRVVSTKVYPYNAVDMRQVLSPINAALPGLNLMTCTGPLIKGTGSFSQRLVVFTNLVR